MLLDTHWVTVLTHRFMIPNGTESYSNFLTTYWLDKVHCVWLCTALKKSIFKKLHQIIFQQVRSIHDSATFQLDKLFQLFTPLFIHLQNEDTWGSILKHLKLCLAHSRQSWKSSAFDSAFSWILQFIKVKRGTTYRKLITNSKICNYVYFGQICMSLPFSLLN